MSEIKGSCLCGKVTYTASAEPVFTGLCHCKTCQKGTGSAFTPVIAVPTASLTVNGMLTRFDGVGGSGNATHRFFCPTCGSTVTETADVMAGITMVTIGTLDDANSVNPTMQIFCDSALPWAKLPDMQAFAKMNALARVARNEV
jgi:hypothetical protein